MPHLPNAIELHDSMLSRIDVRGSSIHIHLRPAYIHRDGKGWIQDVEIIVNEATLEGGKVNLPTTISDGSLQTQSGLYHNLLNFPFVAAGSVKIELELMSGEMVIVKGNGISHVFKGEPVFVEDIPNT